VLPADGQVVRTAGDLQGSWGHRGAPKCRKYLDRHEWPDHCGEMRSSWDAAEEGAARLEPAADHPPTDQPLRAARREEQAHAPGCRPAQPPPAMTLVREVPVAEQLALTQTDTPAGGSSSGVRHSNSAQ